MNIWSLTRRQEPLPCLEYRHPSRLQTLSLEVTRQLFKNVVSLSNKRPTESLKRLASPKLANHVSDLYITTPCHSWIDRDSFYNWNWGHMSNKGWTKTSSNNLQINPKQEASLLAPSGWKVTPHNFSARLCTTSNFFSPPGEDAIYEAQPYSIRDRTKYSLCSGWLAIFGRRHPCVLSSWRECTWSM